MTNKPVVLVVSTKVDLATDAVMGHLSSNNVECYRINTEDFPFDGSFGFYPGDSESRLAFNGAVITDPTSIWYRRIRTPSTPAGMDEGVSTFCRQETRAAMVGALIGRSARWMSHPAAIWQAEYKPYQLQLASKYGLTIPRTVITNDPTIIRAAFESFGELIIKPVRSGYFVSGGEEYAIYTSRVLSEHLDQLESARWSPSIYQALIPKKCDIRVTFVGDRCFAAAIDSQSDAAAQVDWRQTENPALPHARIELPTSLESALRQYMEALSLTFGAIDLVETPQGEYVFLEVNPSGQWLWLDEMLDLQISATVADWLCRTA